MNFNLAQPVMSTARTKERGWLYLLAATIYLMPNWPLWRKERRGG